MACMTRAAALLLAGACWLAAPPPVLADTPADLLAGYARASGQAPDPEAGRRFFTSTHGGRWSCSSCHAARPSGPGRHASTGKPIDPLAPGFNAERFTQPSKVEKWFRRNCRDVLSRPCSDSEKADVMAWLLSLKP